MRTHDLKTWPEFFAAVFDGRKRFEVRKDDRGFQAGDLILLREWDPERRDYTGSSFGAQITYVLPGGQFGVEPGYVVLGF